MYGFIIFCEISKGTFEISYNILNLYTAKYAFYCLVFLRMSYDIVELWRHKPQWDGLRRSHNLSWHSVISVAVMLMRHHCIDTAKRATDYPMSWWRHQMETFPRYLCYLYYLFRVIFVMGIPILVIRRLYIGMIPRLRLCGMETQSHWFNYNTISGAI